MSDSSKECTVALERLSKEETPNSFGDYLLLLENRATCCGFLEHAERAYGTEVDTQNGDWECFGEGFIRSDAFRVTGSAKEVKGNVVEVFLAFRGTQNPEEIFADACAFLEPVSFLQCEGEVHAGFQKAYLALRGPFLDHCRKDVEQLRKPGCQLRFKIAGHSLGGALATLAAMDLKANDLFPGLLLEVQCVTWGSPRVGDHKLALFYKCLGLIEKTARFTNKFDLVPRVPPSSNDDTSGYWHLLLGKVLNHYGLLEKLGMEDYEHVCEETQLDDGMIASWEFWGSTSTVAEALSRHYMEVYKSNLDKAASLETERASFYKGILTSVVPDSLHAAVADVATGADLAAVADVATDSVLRLASQRLGSEIGTRTESDPVDQSQKKSYQFGDFSKGLLRKWSSRPKQGEGYEIGDFLKNFVRTKLEEREEDSDARPSTEVADEANDDNNKSTRCAEDVCPPPAQSQEG